jgi:hypothetical protein
MVEHIPLPCAVFTTNEQVVTMTDDGPRVSLQVKVHVSTPTGLFVFYMPVDMAIKTAKAFMKHARVAELNGLQLPESFMPDVPEED